MLCSAELFPRNTLIKSVCERELPPEFFATDSKICVQNVYLFYEFYGMAFVKYGLRKVIAMWSGNPAKSKNFVIIFDHYVGVCLS